MPFLQLLPAAQHMPLQTRLEGQQAPPRQLPLPPLTWQGVSSPAGGRLHCPKLQVGVAQPSGLSGHCELSWQSTHVPPQQNWRNVPQAARLLFDLVVGVVPLQLGTLQSAGSSSGGGSDPSATWLLLPAPSQAMLVQLPGMPSSSVVPWGFGRGTHAPAMHALESKHSLAGAAQGIASCDAVSNPHVPCAQIGVSQVVPAGHSASTVHCGPGPVDTELDAPVVPLVDAPPAEDVVPVAPPRPPLPSVGMPSSGSVHPCAAASAVTARAAITRRALMVRS